MSDPKTDFEEQMKKNRELAAAKRSEGKRQVVTERASSFKPRATRWLWKDRLPLGENALMTGREDTGKSTVLLDIGAKITRGTLPGELFGEPRDVIIATTEDSWEHTIVPRLLAAHADLERVHRVAVRIENVGEFEISLPDDVKGLETKVLELRAAMVIVDPLIPKLNRKLDSYKDAEARLALEPLIGIAHRTGCSIVGIVHHNKSNGADPLNAVMGSKAFVAAVRAVMSVIIEDDDSGIEIHYLCLPKHNLGTAQPSLTFEIESATVGEDEGRPITAGKIRWTGESRDSAATIMARKAKGERPVDKAEEWLAKTLSTERPSSEVKAEAKKAGISETTLKRAAKSLDVRVSGGGKAGTTWKLDF